MNEKQKPNHRIRRYKQGYFRPANPEKYIGNANNIVYRSWLEFRAMYKLDHDSNIVKWASEEFPIPYRMPGENFNRRYFIDLFYETKKGEKFIIEIKPEDQTKPPKKGRKRQKTILREQADFAMNVYKWQAAKEWAKKNKCKFGIWTEKTLENF